MDISFQGPKTGVEGEKKKPSSSGRKWSTCAVSKCPSPGTAVYHRFPKDESLRKEWIRACDRERINLDNARVCDTHFRSSDYERDLKNELLGLPQRKRLKKGAVPNLNLSEYIYPDLASKEHGYSLPVKLEPSQEVDEEEKRLERQMFVESILQAAEEKKKLEEEEERYKFGKSFGKDTKKKKKRGFSLDNSSRLLHKSLKINVGTQFQSLDAKKFRALKAELRNQRAKTRRLEFKLRRWEERIKKAESIPSDRSILKRELLTKYDISPNYFNFILGRTARPGHWTEREIFFGVLLFCVSQKVYNIIRENKILPLPGVSTIKRYLHTFKWTTGLQISSLESLRKKFVSECPTGRLCCLSFTRICIKETAKFDYGEKTNYETILLVVLQGLSSPWRRLVYADFDKKMKSTLLCDIIRDVETTCGAVVVAISREESDNYEDDALLIRELGVSMDNPYFISVSPTGESNKIFVFSDAGGIIKSFRNNLLRGGFILSDGNTITKEVFTELLRSDDASLFKLKPTYLDPRGSDRRKLLPAINLFSRTVANALSHRCPTLSKEGVRFVNVLNDWFDVFNSRNDEDEYFKKKKPPLKDEFGNFLEEQKTALLEGINLASKCLKIGAESSLPCQIGLISTSNALMALFEYLKSKYEVKSILTSRLNLEHFDDLSARVRTLEASYEKNSPLPAMSQLMLLFLSEGTDNSGDITEKKKIDTIHSENIESCVVFDIGEAVTDIST